MRRQAIGILLSILIVSVSIAMSQTLPPLPPPPPPPPPHPPSFPPPPPISPPSDAPGDSCGDGKVYDCIGSCIDEATALAWIGDGSCDNGSFSDGSGTPVDLRCNAFNNDGGDCDDTTNPPPPPAPPAPPPPSTIPGEPCGTNKILDCVGSCVDEATAFNWIGDGSCDNGSFSDGSGTPVDLRCNAFNNDGGDCDDTTNPPPPPAPPAPPPPSTIPGEPCGTNKILDCVGSCVDEATAFNWIGDGSCDDGTHMDGVGVPVDLRCDAFGNDGGDCDTSPPPPPPPPSPPPPGGTNPGDSCGTGRIIDCVGSCVDEATAIGWLGDGTCDDGSSTDGSGSPIDLRCDAFNNDNGDCDSPPENPPPPPAPPPGPPAPPAPPAPPPPPPPP